ncbi:hypothetical protein [uncultured Psychroserpens sp.]|uniref:hypothetical protein n=1 Tax=uncultured Psychroserpens sp. TaxID=255436 RepID=UPI00263945E0|nr:hypothetical protein [uncultured Psychroserpens sp.]
MKSALKLILIILLLTYGMDKLMYMGLNKISDKVMSGQSIGKLNQFMILKDSLDVIAFGTSRSNHHIDVKKIKPSSYNVGMDGSAIAYSATLIQLLPKDKDQLIIFNIDPNKVFVDDYDASDVKGLITKYNRNPIIKKAVSEANQDNVLQHFLWSLDYNGKAIGIVKNYVSPKYDHKMYYGFDPLDITEAQTETFKKSLSIKSNYDCDDTKKINPDVWKYINQINDFCKANNKTLVMLTTPTYDPECKVQYDTLKKALQSIGVSYEDYSGFFLEHNDLSYWKDKTHMSSKGAEVFTTFLKTELQKKQIIN